MTPNEKLELLATQLNGANTDEGLKFATKLMKSEDVNVLVVTIQDREEFPIYVTVDESQILCISHLWREDEVKPETRTTLLEHLLSLNIPMPLSSFSMIGKQYTIFGAAPTTASVDQIIEEISVLSHNTLTAIEEMAEYLK